MSSQQQQPVDIDAEAAPEDANLDYHVMEKGEPAKQAVDDEPIDQDEAEQKPDLLTKILGWLIMLLMSGLVKYDLQTFEIATHPAFPTLYREFGDMDVWEDVEEYDDVKPWHMRLQDCYYAVAYLRLLVFKANRPRHPRLPCKGTKGRYNGIGTNGNGRFGTHKTAQKGPKGDKTRVYVGANMADKDVAIRTLKISKELASLPPKLLKEVDVLYGVKALQAMRWWTPRVNKAYQQFMVVVTGEQPPEDVLGLNGTTCLSNMMRAYQAQISNAAPVPRPLAVASTSSTLNSFFASASASASAASSTTAASNSYDCTTTSSAGRVAALSSSTPELTAQVLAAASTSKAGWPRVLHIGTGKADRRKARIGFQETLLGDKKQMNLYPSSSNLQAAPPRRCARLSKAASPSSPAQAHEHTAPLAFNGPIEVAKVLSKYDLVLDWGNRSVVLSWENVPCSEAVGHRRHCQSPRARRHSHQRRRSPLLGRPPCQRVRSLYGLKQSGREWYVRLSQELLNAGFTKSSFDPCIFTHSCGSLIAVYVDDVFIISKDKEAESRTSSDNWLYSTQLASVILCPSLSLGATPIGGHQPPEVKRPVKLIRREERGHPDWTSTFVVIHDTDLRIDLTGSSAWRLVAEGLVLYLAACEKGEEFDSEAWIAQRAFDPWTPARMPGYSLDTKLRRPGMKIAGRKNVIFRDFEAFGIGSILLLDRIMAEQSKHGRAHVIEHWIEILTKWSEARTAVQRRTRKGTTTPSPWPMPRAGSDWS